jgi:hypothetical protein
LIAALARLVAVAALVGAPLTVAPAGPAAATGPDCVALVVDRAPGSVATRCVTWTSGITGVQVLRNAGYAVQFRRDGLICRIGGFPATCAADATHYWSYWHRAPGSSSWTYSTEGASTYRPPRGSTEGWAYLDGSSRRPAGIAFGTICPPPPPRTTPPPTTAPRTAAPPRRPAPAPTAATTRPPLGGGSDTDPAPGGAAPPARSPGTGGTIAGTPTASRPGSAAPTDASTATGASPSPVASAGDTGAEPDPGGGAPVAALFGLLLAGALGGGALWRARRRRPG